MKTPPHRPRFSSRHVLGVAVSTSLVAALAGCGGETLRSRWHDRPITIDARTRDWEGGLITLDDRGMDVGAVNDGDSLFVCLVLGTRDTQLQAIHGGLTLWLDPSGGDTHTLGIRFPIVSEPPRRERRRDEERPREVLEDAWRSLDREHALEVIGADGAQEILPIDGSAGIALRAGEEHAQLVYELRIPLGTGRFGLDTRGGKIGVTLETSALGRPDGRPGGRPAGGPGAGRPDRGEWGPPPGGGRPGGFERPEPLELHATIELAASPGER